MSESPTHTSEHQLPSVQEFCTTTSLYKGHDISECTSDEIIAFIFFEGTIDSYCPMCKQNSTFKAHMNKRKRIEAAAITGAGQPFALGSSPTTPVQEPSRPSHPDQDFDLEFHCARNNTHTLKFYFAIRDSQIYKVGQYPSLASLHLGGISKYRKLLGEDKYAEFARAIRLHAHDIGIGSFTYLRRVFEHLINKAHEAASQEPNWNETAYEKARMPDKIRLLKNHLPKSMVQNANLYGILSKGLHELTEDECLKYFTTIEKGLEIILDEEIARQRKKRKVISSEIGRITGEIRSR